MVDIDQDCISLAFFFRDYGSLYVAWKDGVADQMRSAIVEELRARSYASVFFDSTVVLVFDCYENVKKHYGRNFFYRDLDGSNRYAICFREKI